MNTRHVIPGSAVERLAYVVDSLGARDRVKEVEAGSRATFKLDLKAVTIGEPPKA